VKPDREAIFEGGLLVFLLGFLGGLAMLLFGRAAGEVQRRQRHTEAQPAPGSVPAERHHNTGGVSAR
jgi:hypothetical protein